MSLRIDRRQILAVAIGAVAVPRIANASEQDRDVPYVPTAPEVVEGMLDMAKLKTGERLIDLGSGDGRIPVAAAKRGANALGIEIDGRLVRRARALAEMVGQADRARFEQADLFTVSLRDADVVTLYLLPQINARLRPKLLVEMRPGARVVSHAFDMGDWVPDEARTVGNSDLYLWTIPAVAGGDWRLTSADGGSSRLTVEQRYNKVSGTLDGHMLRQARLHGAMLEFVANGVRYRGTVGDRAITGDPAFPAWRAERME